MLVNGSHQVPDDLFSCLELSKIFRFSKNIYHIHNLSKYSWVKHNYGTINITTITALISNTLSKNHLAKLPGFSCWYLWKSRLNCYDDIELIPLGHLLTAFKMDPMIPTVHVNLTYEFFFSYIISMHNSYLEGF